jgi:poly(ADP-ribose) glycohydrolase ARH3
MIHMTIKSKFSGGIIGSALGDAIGELAFSFGNKERLLQEVGNKKTVRYTDDTAMAIGIAETILSTNGNWTTQEMGEHFHLNYKHEPYRGYGMGPPIIFRTVEDSGKKYQDIAETLYGGEGSYGNGASMRIAPLGIYYYDAENIYSIAKKSAVATHTHSFGVDGAAILAKLLSKLVPKDPIEWDIKDHREEIIDLLINFAKTEKYKEKLSEVRSLLLNGFSFEKAERKLGSDILAYTSVPFSIFAFLKEPSSFYECLLHTITISKDRDTVGAMVGGLLGGYLGIENIPEKWINKLENLTYFRKLADDLYKLKAQESS